MYRAWSSTLLFESDTIAEGLGALAALKYEVEGNFHRYAYGTAW